MMVDVEKGSPIHSDYLDVEYNRSVMKRLSNGKCIALKEFNGKYYCDVYEYRPKVCSSFVNGSDRCKSIRTANKFPV